MKRKTLFIILCIATLTVSACGKTETPVTSNSVKTEVETETTTVEETSTEEVVETTEAIAEEVTENNQETNTSNVDSTGSDGIIEEGDYIEPSVNENLSEVESAIEQAKKDMQEFYEAGIISEEDYKAAMETLEKGPQTGSSIIPSESSQDAAAEAIAKKYEEATIKARESSTNGQGDQRTNIQYGQGDYTGLEHIRIN